MFQVSLEENLAMIADTVAYLKKHGREVLYDAEHFFDSYKEDPEYSLRDGARGARCGRGPDGALRYEWRQRCRSSSSRRRAR